MRGRFSKFGNRLFGRKHSQRRNKKHRSISQNTAFARRLRCEPLEDRALLNGLSLLQENLPSNLEGHLLALLQQEVTKSSAVIDAAPEQHTVALEDTRSSLLTFDGEGRVCVDVWTLVPPLDVAPRLSDMGFQLLASSEEYHLLEGSLPVDSLVAVSGLSEVLSITPIYQPIFHSGSLTTQGDGIVHADDARALGHDGSPLLIGALSDSALKIANSQATGDLPPTVDRYLEFYAKDEGRAMLEIVHDLAPGAQLAHHSGILNGSSFSEGIRELAMAGAKIICDDLYFPDEPFFQDGIIAQAVNDVVQSYGVTYITAAGNQATDSYESFFVDSGSNNYHDYDSSVSVDTRQQITVPAGYYTKIFFQWDDPFYTSDGVTHDYDIHIYDDAGTETASGTTDNIATQQPLEAISWEVPSSSSGTYEIEIRRTAGDGPSLLKYILFTSEAIGSIDEFATNSGTVVGHAAAAGAIAVGAVPFYDESTIEPFSSCGNATIYFDPEGNRLATPEIREKPDVVAPDNVNTTFFGTDIPEDDDSFPNFGGTSAAAPHVAGVAALVLDANPHLTHTELYEVLTSTAVDLGDVGRDQVYGYGLVNALDACNYAVTKPDVTCPNATLLSPGELSGWNVGVIEVQFSEPVEPSAAQDASNYTLVEAGPDGDFDTGDDVDYSIEAVYNDDPRQTTITITAPYTRLPTGDYCLTLNAVGGIADTFGNELNDGVDQTFVFAVGFMGQITTLDGVRSGYQLDVRPDGSVVVVDSYRPVLSLHSWDQVMVGQYDPNGQSEGPYRSVPVMGAWTEGFHTVDVSVNATGGVIVYDEQSVTPLNHYRAEYQLLDLTGRPVGMEWPLKPIMVSKLCPA